MEKVSSKMLVEKWTPLIESEKARTVKNKEVMAQILENQEASLNESGSTALGDIAQYTPILVPAVRRIFPNLLANEICGVQALNGPTGYAFALRFGYENAKGKKNINGSGIVYPTAPRAVQKNSQAFGAFAAVLTGVTGSATTATTNTFSAGVISGGDKVFIGTTEVGTLSIVESASQGTKVLINLTSSGTASLDYYADTINGVVSVVTAAAPTTPITGTIALSKGLVGAAYLTGTPVVTFNNEAGFNLVFTSQAYFNYASTASAEYQSRSTMKSMKMSMEKFAVDVQTRKLKAEYSIELAQDLKQVHGVDAEAELINILEYEISAELDRELVEAVYSNVTSAGTWAYGSVGQYTSTPATGNAFSINGIADGRYEMEKFRTLYTRIVREANAVAIATRRGAANFIICSLNVASALECLSNFMYSAVPGNVETTIGVAKIGTLDGRFTVYLDTFAYDDFFVVGYKGNTAFDTGIIYCPYVPLMVQKITDPDTLQPVIGMQCRDAIVGNMWGAEKYYRKVTCNFAGSSLVQGNYYV
jgi:hypothetical protein